MRRENLAQEGARGGVHLRAVAEPASGQPGARLAIKEGLLPPDSYDPRRDRDRLEVSEVIERLRLGAVVDDADFDQVYPLMVRTVSGFQWTPLATVDRVVGLIAPTECTRVLDVGSGVGKFCIAATLRGPGSFTGIERRWDRHLVALATREQFGAERATLLHGDALAVDWRGYDVLYFFNPFQELIAHALGAPAEGLRYGPEVQGESVQSARQKLRDLAVGTRVVLYHGLGDDLPEGYAPAEAMPRPAAELEVWIKVSGGR